MSDTPHADQTDAEPVDAEFEPAPGTAAKPRPGRKTRSGSGIPWLTIALVTVFAGAVGGGSGWLLGRYGPDPGQAGLEDRLAALEAAAEAADPAPIDGLFSRIEAIDAELRAAQLRAQGIEQLVRDVADLRDRVEAQPASLPDRGAMSNDQAEAVAALEARFDQALNALQAQLNGASEAAETARSVAEQAQTALQQTLSAISQAGEEPDSEPAEVQAPGAALIAVEARVAALESASQARASQDDRLRALEVAVAALEAIEPDTGDIDALSGQLATLEAALAALQASTPATPQSASLAERAVAFAALSRAAAGPEPFPVAFADLRRLWPLAPGLDALTDPARTGAPTLDQLTAGFPGDAVRAATGEAQMLFGVIRVERDAEAGPTPAIEAALDAENLAGAVAATEALEADARAAASVWLAQARARLAVEDSLSSLSAALAEEGGAER